MKNILIGFNILLAAAIGFLFYLHYSEKSSASIGDSKKESKVADIMNKPLPESLSGKKILFINIDSLDSQYEGLKDLNKRLMANQSYFKSKYEAEATSFQNDYIEFQKSASAGIKPQDELMRMQAGLEKRKEAIDNMQINQKRIEEGFGEENSKILKDIYSLLKEYSKGKNIDYILATTESPNSVLYANDSLDITREVLNLLNTRYNEVKQTKNK